MGFKVIRLQRVNKEGWGLSDSRVSSECCRSLSETKKTAKLATSKMTSQSRLPGGDQGYCGLGAVGASVSGFEA